MVVVDMCDFHTKFCLFFFLSDCCASHNTYQELKTMQIYRVKNSLLPESGEEKKNMGRIICNYFNSKRVVSFLWEGRYRVRCVVLLFCYYIYFL